MCVCVGYEHILCLMTDFISASKRTIYLVTVSETYDMFCQVLYHLLKRLSLQLATSFEIFSFLFKLFVKVELSYVLTMNLFTKAENCTEK